MKDIETVFDEVEIALRENGCRIQSFIAGKQTQYVIKQGPRNVSVSFDSIFDLVMWAAENIDKLEG